MTAHVKPILIQARTLELYAQLGVLNDILAVASPFGPMASYDFGELVPKSKTAFLFEHQEPTPDVPYVRIKFTHICYVV
jgi:hypothetical protein